MTSTEAGKTSSKVVSPRTPPDIDEAELIRKAQAGDNDAFGVIWKNHESGITRFVRTLLLGGNRNNAEDMVQEIGCKAWKAIGHFRGDSKFSSWLHRIAANHCFTFLKNSEADRTDSIEELEGQKRIEGLEQPGSVENSLVRREMAQLLYDRLKPRDKRIIELVVGAHMDEEKVVAELHEDHKHVRYVLGRFLGKLDEAVNARQQPRRRPTVGLKTNELHTPGERRAAGF